MSSSGLSRLLLRTTAPLHQRCFSTIATTSTTTTAATLFRVKDAVDDIFKERDCNRLVEKFKDCSKHYRFRCKHNVYDHAVRQLAAAHRFSDIEEILEEQKKHTHLAKEGFYIRLITLYGRAGMLDHAIKVFDEMPGLGSDRTVKSMNAVLTACAEGKDFDKVGVLFRELPKKLGVKPDTYSYNILARAFCEVGSVDLAFSLLGEMKSKEINPDVITFNTLLNGFYGGDRRSEAEKVWTEMGNYGVKPDTSSFNAKIRGLVAEGKTAEAVKVLEELESKGLKPDSLSFSLLVKAHCEEGNLEEAKKVLEELKKKDMQPNRLAYEAIIPALCAAEDINRASELCLEVLNGNRFISVEVLQDVIDRLVNISKDMKAKRLVELGSAKSYYYSSLKMPS
ncbi:pentatricopeptide repeat-containing protein At1g55890, mitochondrial-like [Nymphaea colorata]|uniref:Pentacotripeptide-repeat region of PRORP domain-containing protein n=1 Tax=Nymphaea colorata TaxID=210225 RepID=A0A5K0Y794_9MAGN|nr:pentatricopeptide repeat-containing protein At1g55890, mitochondrial-like [Nymphaea colorata]